MLKSVFALCALCLTSFIPSETVNLTVKITGFDGVKGNLVMSIYRATDDYLSVTNPYKYAKVSVSSLEDGKHTLMHLPKNTYAVAVYQDVNKNGKLDANLLGVPTERYGFSNNAWGTFSALSFSETKISLNESRTISIKIK